MNDYNSPPPMRPSSLSLVTVTSLEKKKNIFFSDDFPERYRTSLGFITNNFNDFYDNNLMDNPAIIIDSGSDTDMNSEYNISGKRDSNKSQNNSSVNSSDDKNQLIKYLLPPKAKIRRHAPDLESITSGSTTSPSISRKSVRRNESNRSSRSSKYSAKDDDSISIGACSIAPTMSIDSSIYMDPNYANKIMDSRLLKFMSIIYALVLIIIGAIICVKDLENEFTRATHIFAITATVIGLTWITFLHWDIRRYKRWAIEYLRPDMDDSYDHKYVSELPNLSQFDDNISITTAVIFDSIKPRPAPDDSQASSVTAIVTAYRFLHGKHSGNFYLKIGMTVFCFGSIIHKGVDIVAQIHFMSDHSEDCMDVLLLVAQALQSIFSFYQLFMAFKYSNILINRYKTMAWFALMHLMGTSIAFWFCTITKEAIDDYIHKAINNSTGNSSANPMLRETVVSHQSYCIENSIIDRKAMTALPYLYPFTIEYNIILASVWYVIWTNIGKEHSNSHLNHLRQEITENAMGEEDVHYRSAVSFQVDCHASNRGLFGGLSTLLATFITIVIFFTTQSYDSFGVSIYSAQIGFLTVIGCIVIPLAYRQVRKLDIMQHLDDSNTSMDDLLVLVPIPFYVLHYILLIMAALNDQSFNSIFLIIIHVLTIIQVLLQTPFIVDSMRRCSNSKRWRFLKPGRELITFALILNITLWILNTFEMKSVDTYHGLHEYYGKMTWMVVSHTTVPLMLFYRFHSSVCLSEIWSYAYEKDHSLSHM